MTKVLLGSAAAFLLGGAMVNIGLIKTGSLDFLYAIFPTGAVLLGLALISRLLEKETAGFNRENEEHLARNKGEPALSADNPPGLAPGSDQS